LLAGSRFSGTCSTVRFLLYFAQRKALITDRIGIFAIATILPHISAIRDSVTISARILEDIERVPAIDVSNPDGAKLWDSQTGEQTKVEIELRNVTFSYPSRPDHKSLDDVSFILEAGKVTALVGGE
jgi:ATP-binding cassette subfamily B (MDR/TAP) protein 1